MAAGCISLYVIFMPIMFERSGLNAMLVTQTSQTIAWLTATLIIKSYTWGTAEVTSKQDEQPKSTNSSIESASQDV